MGKKKLFKRLLAVVMALVLSNVVTTMERAEAATCPPHGSYYDSVRNVIESEGTHRVKKRVYGVDENGFLIDITDNLLNPEYVICKVKAQYIEVDVKCTKCNTIVGGYNYTTEEHSYSYCN